MIGSSEGMFVYMDFERSGLRVTTLLDFWALEFREAAWASVCIVQERALVVRGYPFILLSYLEAASVCSVAAYPLGLRFRSRCILLRLRRGFRLCKEAYDVLYTLYAILYYIIEA